jgi:hypothetical protein
VTVGDITPRIGARTYDVRLDAYAVDGIDPEALIAAATEALERPSDSAWRDDDVFSTHTLMFATPDWSLTDEYIIGQANYRAILEDMSAAYARHPGAVESATFGHWTYSRFQCIKVRVIYADGTIHPAFVDAYAIAQYLERDYPLYSEEAHSELECEVWERAVGMAISDARRDTDDDSRESETWEEAFRESISEWFGYSEPGYIEEDHVNAATSAADSAVTREIETGIPRNTSGEYLEGL